MSRVVPQPGTKMKTALAIALPRRGGPERPWRQEIMVSWLSDAGFAGGLTRPVVSQRRLRPESTIVVMVSLLQIVELGVK